jgi:acetyltransferase-like isoleucine patch superfamily enzyme
MISKLRLFLRRSRNRRLLSRCGENSVVDGLIEVRRAGGSVEVGADSLIQGTLVTEIAESRLSIGNNVFVGGGTVVDCVLSIRVDDDVLISHGCLISDSDNHSVRYSVRRKDLRDWRQGGGHDWSTTQSAPIVIGRGAWIGARAIILKGVTIQEGAVVAAGAVVTQDVPEYAIVAGNPARVVRVLGKEER